MQPAEWAIDAGGVATPTSLTLFFAAIRRFLDKPRRSTEVLFAVGIFLASRVFDQNDLADRMPGFAAFQVARSMSCHFFFGIGAHDAGAEEAMSARSPTAAAPE